MTLIRIRGDTAANWTSVNPVLAYKELAAELDTRKLKIGDGTTAWTSLAYVDGGSGYTDEQAQDAVGTILLDSSSIDFTYNDGAGTITAVLKSHNIDGQAFDASADITVIAPGTHAATSKTTPVDADEMPLVDSAASNVLKKLTWANLKAAVRTYILGQANSWTARQTVSGGLVDSSSLNARFQNASAGVSGTSGPGIEIRGADTIIQSFNRTSSTFGPLALVTSQLSLSTDGSTIIGNYANDAAAATGGVPVNGIYRNGSVLMIRVS